VTRLVVGNFQEIVVPKLATWYDRSLYMVRSLCVCACVCVLLVLSRARVLERLRVRSTPPSSQPMPGGGCAVVCT
jgi:hypothetical protein